MENELVTLGAQAEKEITPIAAKATDVAQSIKDQGSYERAAIYLQSIKAARKRVGEILDPFVQAAHAAWKKAGAERDKYAEPLDKAEAIVKPAMASWWSQEQERQESERRRLEAEERKREEDRRLAEAENLAQNGDHGAAEAVLDEPIHIAPPVMPQTPQSKGISMRENWKFEVTDVKALVQAVAKGQVPLTAIMPNATFLGQQTRSLKGEMKYPGVKVWPVKTVASGSF